MQSLRDLGYDLPAAVADLVDNSIAARATTVRIDVGFDGKDSWIRVADNGKGMTGPTLTEAMRYGSQRDDYDEEDLGKYGLGLKTASMSQCRLLTVASRFGTGGRIQIRQWDLDQVMKRDDWDLEIPTASECRPELLEPLDGHKGTVVMWQRLDRLLKFAHPDGQAAENALLRQCRDIERHLAMVFHRFLAGEARRSLPLRILLNDNPIATWDPFCRDQKATKELETHKLVLDVEGVKHVVRVEPYLVPNKDRFSDAKSWEDAGGPKNWNAQQGFYIYRADRLIQSGGWSRTRTLDEHTKIARVAVLFERGADEEFGINVAKMSVVLPRDLREDFQKIAADVAKKADTAYRKTDEKAPRGRASSASTSRAGGGTGPTRGGVGNLDKRREASLRLIRRIVHTLEDELGNQPRLLRRVLLALGRVDPVFAAAVREATRAS
ncbi:MAG: ATP-binding protein [Chloroflexota bacterium]|nr:ATP-binding protein [Chloroflexota bacterium]